MEEIGNLTVAGRHSFTPMRSILWTWYSAYIDRDDNDWGTGSFDLGEAKKMALNYGPEAYIAVIENDVCVEEIDQADF